MNRIIVAILLISYCNANDYYEGDSLIRKGVYAFYNYEFDKAVEILTDCRIQYPEHPGVHLIWAASRWVEAQAFLSVNETYEILENDLGIIQTAYDTLVVKYYYDSNYKLYQGSALGLSARVALGKKQWLKTLFHSYKGFQIIRDITKESPSIIDAQLPIGIVEYFAGISNPIVNWAIKLYDLEPSTESGLRRIALAADEGSWAWIEAKAILSNLYLWVENEPILALQYSSDLVREFPKNFYFNLMYLEANIRTSKINLSATIIEDMENNISYLSSRQKEWYVPYLNYEKALFSFFNKEYTKALILVTEAIEDYSAELDIILGNAYLLQGMCYDKLYERGNAKGSYINCIALDNFSGSMIKAKEYLKKPFSGI